MPTCVLVRLEFPWWNGCKVCMCGQIHISEKRNFLSKLQHNFLFQVWPLQGFQALGLSRMPPFLCGTMCGARGAVAGDMDGSWRSVCMMLCVCVLVLVCYPLNYQFDVFLIHHECRSLTGTLGVCSIVFCMFAIYPRVKTEMNATKLSLPPRSESTLATWSPSMWQAWSVPLGATVSVVLCYHWLPSFNIEVPIICVYNHIYIHINIYTCSFSIRQSQLGKKETMPVTCTGFGHVWTKVREPFHRKTWLSPG